MRVLNLVLAFFIIAFIFTAESYSIGVQVVVKGKVIDEFTGKPTEAQIEFKTSSGNKFKIKSNSLDGSYSQVFAAGESVEATFTNFDLIKTTSSFTVDKAEKFKEQSLDLKVKKLTQGVAIYESPAFEIKGNNINEESKAAVLKLEEIMTFNRNVKFEISINAHDSYGKILKTETKKTTTKKGKKKTEEVETKTTTSEPNSNEIKSLVESRLNQVTELIKQFKKFQNRVTITPDFTSADAVEDASKLSNNHSLKIIVKEIKNQLE